MFAFHYGLILLKWLHVQKSLDKFAIYASKKVLFSQKVKLMSDSGFPLHTHHQWFLLLRTRIRKRESNSAIYVLNSCSWLLLQLRSHLLFVFWNQARSFSSVLCKGGSEKWQEVFNLLCNRTIFSSQSKKANKNQQIQNGKQHKDPSMSKQNLKNDDLNLDIIILTSFVWSHSILVSSTWLNKMIWVKFKLIQTRHKIWLPGKSIRR